MEGDISDNVCKLYLAENLVIGETVQPQNRRSVHGFLCDGIVSRIGAGGVLRL